MAQGALALVTLQAESSQKLERPTEATALPDSGAAGRHGGVLRVSDDRIADACVADAGIADARVSAGRANARVADARVSAGRVADARVSAGLVAGAVLRALRARQTRLTVWPGQTRLGVCPAAHALRLRRRGC